MNWLALLEELCQCVLLAERRGRPAVLLRDMPRAASDRILDLHGLRIYQDHPLILFGDGASGKSLLTLWIAGELAQRGWCVLYCDWELTPEEHRDRFERLFGSDMPPVRYARCDRPLTYEIDRLARLRQQHQADYLICDSISFACDGPPEASEVAGRYFQAIRQLGVGSTHLAHTNRSDRADEKPFGSAFWHNGARATWFMKREEDSRDDSMLVGLFNKKSNLGRLLPATGFRIQFEQQQNRTIISRTDVADNPDLAVRLPLKERIRYAISHGPDTLANLAARLEANTDSIDRTIRRFPKLFTRVPGSDGVSRIALVEKRSA